ncbi:hypothetical protein BH23BAC3_BH23BAC3_26910 [soil metagenome]
MANITLFSQIISKLDRFSFNKLVKARQTDKHQKGYTSWTHLVSMLFCSREIKQLLHIKSFIGTSENAVMIQIWTALITILILKALKAMATYGWYLSNLVGFIRLNLFVKIDLQRWLDHPFESEHSPPTAGIQGVLF